jgi:hypothetical protein
MIQHLLRRYHLSFLALPNLQSRLLDGSGKRNANAQVPQLTKAVA